MMRGSVLYALMVNGMFIILNEAVRLPICFSIPKKKHYSIC